MNLVNFEATRGRLCPWPPSGWQKARSLWHRNTSERSRFGERYAEFRSLAEDGEGWSHEQVQEYQLKQLRQVLIQAGNYCPHYKQAFSKAAFRPEMVTEMDDLRDCPYLERKDLMARPDAFLSSDVPAKERVMIGAKLQSQTLVEPAKEQAFLEAQWKRAGYAAGQKMVVLMAEGTSQAPAPQPLYDMARDWLWCPASLVTEGKLHELMHACGTFNARMLCAPPQEALRLAGLLRGSGMTWPGGLSALFCESGQITLSDKQRLAEVFGCRIFRWFGSAEIGFMAAEGRTSNLLHFCPQYGLVELGEPNADGWCEIVATPFHNLAMPLVRYRTGWSARLADPQKDGALEFPWPAASEIAAL